MNPEVIIGGDPGDSIDILDAWETTEAMQPRLGKYSASIRRAICASSKGGDDMPHPLTPIVGPIIKGLIDNKKGQQPTCAPAPSPSPPLTPLPTLSKPVEDDPSDGDKGSKGPQSTSDGRRKVTEKKWRLRHNLP